MSMHYALYVSAWHRSVQQHIPGSDTSYAAPGAYGVAHGYRVYAEFKSRTVAGTLFTFRADLPMKDQQSCKAVCKVVVRKHKKM